jgi:hypothetical protein
MIVSLATRQPSLTCGHRNHRKEQTSLRARRAWQPPDVIARLRSALLQPDRGCRVASLLAMTSVLFGLAMTLVLSGRLVQVLPYSVCTIKSDLLQLPIKKTRTNRLRGSCFGLQLAPDSGSHRNPDFLDCVAFNLANTFCRYAVLIG